MEQISIVDPVTASTTAAKISTFFIAPATLLALAFRLLLWRC
jgi:hypothetical protein